MYAVNWCNASNRNLTINYGLSYARSFCDEQAGRLYSAPLKREIIRQRSEIVNAELQLQVEDIEVNLIYANCFDHVAIGQQKHKIDYTPIRETVLQFNWLSQLNVVDLHEYHSTYDLTDLEFGDAMAAYFPTQPTNRRRGSRRGLVYYLVIGDEVGLSSASRFPTGPNTSAAITRTAGSAMTNLYRLARHTGQRVVYLGTPYGRRSVNFVNMHPGPVLNELWSFLNPGFRYTHRNPVRYFDLFTYNERRSVYAPVSSNQNIKIEHYNYLVQQPLPYLDRWIAYIAQQDSQSYV